MGIAFQSCRPPAAFVPGGDRQARRRRHLDSVKLAYVKSAVVVILILLILATGLPMVMGMDGLRGCPGCLTVPSPHLIGLCLGLLGGGFVLVTLVIAAYTGSPSRLDDGRLHRQNLLRPPRAA